MKEKSLNSAMQWYEQRPLRERILLLICLLVVGFFVWDSLIMNPINLRSRIAQKQISEIQAELTGLSAQEAAIEKRRQFDPDKDNRERLNILNEESGRLQQQLEENVSNLITPQEMPKLLETLLSQQKKLQLLSLENLPVEVLTIKEQATEEVIGSALYLHRLSMEFAGDYLATIAYLQTLEELPKHLVWEVLEIETEKYPRARVRLEVYTLSLTEGWIGG